MGNTSSAPKARDPKEKYRAFPGSAFLEKTFCGSIDTTDPDEYEGVSAVQRLLKKADIMCVSSGDERDDRLFPEEDKSIHPSSALLARALVTEVTDNPKTMKPAAMAEREYLLLKAQQAAAKRMESDHPKKPVGAPGGVGPPHVLNSFAYACTGDESAADLCTAGGSVVNTSSVMRPGPLQENRAMNIIIDDDDTMVAPAGKYSVVIGLAMSRRHSSGHSETVTRQTAYDFNQLQDRAYKYVSSTDKYGWRAGGGERGGPIPIENGPQLPEDTLYRGAGLSSPPRKSPSPTPTAQVKEASPDSTHIPIIQIDCPSQEAVDQVIHALASGDIFIPHMAVQPEALSVNGISPPDLVVRFGCERNEDMPPDEWPNWALEFMHNQLYEYFYNAGARWMKRPFSITLARKVRWKTVKHMNRYFAHAEKVIEEWRELGPQYLDPQLAYIEGGATPDEVARPHGIYLLRNGVPTNYFAPNFEPPYTTKMTRSLLQNVLDKSWDRKRREWSNEPVPKLVSPSMLMAAACGCADPDQGGFIASEATKRRTDLPEEKKSDEPRKSSASSSREGSPDDFATAGGSVAASGFGVASVAAASGTTTVVHTNTSVDWKDTIADAPGSSVLSPKWAKKKSLGTSSLERERRQHTELINKVNQQTGKSQFNLGATQAVIDREKAKGYPSSPRRKGESSDSAISLDYSTDGSSAFITLDGSSLLGQDYAGGDSVMTPATVAAKMRQQASREDDDDDGMAQSESELSIQESTSSMQSEIPTDEELYAIGWAKALDQKSGSYYYFTLDRSQTVWENPLSNMI